jgi:ferritin-like metal-binding protein YciE
MSKVTTMDELFVDELRDLYDAEKQLTKALPRMAKAASSDELRSAFEEHLSQTHGHVERLEAIFGLLDERPDGKKCAAMAGLIKEGDEIAGDTEDESAVRDAGLIVAAQKVEHYEISGYGSAKILGYTDAVSLLDQTLNEEKKADEKLGVLARPANKESNQINSAGMIEMDREPNPLLGTRTRPTAYSRE